MAVIKRSADIKLSNLVQGAPAEYDTFSEVAAELAALKAKLDLITVTENINLDGFSNAFLFGTAEDFEAALITDAALLPDRFIGSVEDFEIALVTEASDLPEGSNSLSDFGDIDDFETALIN
jgi:hypothetical protein